MVKHIVCFKLIDNSPEKCEEMKDIFLSMRGKVPQALDIQVGVDFLHSPRSFDVILEVLVNDRKALDLYQEDPYHVSVVKKYVHSVIEKSVAVDYEV